MKSAFKGFSEWRKVGLKERAKSKEAFANRIRENTKELALIDCVDSGNALIGMEGDIYGTADSLA